VSLGVASLPQDGVIAFPARPTDAAVAPEPRRPGVLRRLLREPLTHFVLLGAAIFAIMHVVEARSSRFLIRLGPEETQRLVASYAQQYGIAPDATQLRMLIRERIRQDIFYREAQALGLDREDEVVRRRIAQKYEFLIQDNVVPRTPDETELRRYYDAHRQDYAAPARRSFEQVYFAIDQRGEQAARQLAQRAADVARAAGPVPAGDDFPGPQTIRLLSQADIARTFGGERFAAQVFSAPQGGWTGPLRSGFGWHIVRVTEAEPGQSQGFADARAAVLRDWTQADRTAQNEAAYSKLRARYRVELDP
jgi:parvulin-like peptidyl-prolyl isomerase